MPCHRLAPTALLAIPQATWSHENPHPETRRSALSLVPMAPVRLNNLSLCDVSPEGIQRGPTRPTQCSKDSAAHSRGIPSPQGKWPEKKNLLFTGSERPQLGFASLFLWFLFSRFLGLEKKGWQPVDPPRQGVGVGFRGFRIRGKVPRLLE